MSACPATRIMGGTYIYRTRRHKQALMYTHTHTNANTSRVYPFVCADGFAIDVTRCNVRHFFLLISFFFPRSCHVSNIRWLMMMTSFSSSLLQKYFAIATGINSIEENEFYGWLWYGLLINVWRRISYEIS